MTKTLPNLKCPVKGCGWEVSPLLHLNVKNETREDEYPEDTYVTQHLAMMEHLLEDHEARIGGRSER